MREHADLTEIQTYLSDVEYPASKAELIDAAQTAGADPVLIAALERLPDREFDSAMDVSQAVRESGSETLPEGEEEEYDPL